MHVRPQYQVALASKGGWLSCFILFAFLTVLAFLRGAIADVISGSDNGLLPLVLCVVTLVALVLLLLRKPLAYYLFVALGIFTLVQLGLAMLSAPDKLLYTDWKFDVPVAIEWLLALGWTLYFVSSRRVYSALLAKRDAVQRE
jgi:hypothetical protein